MSYYKEVEKAISRSRSINELVEDGMSRDQLVTVLQAIIEIQNGPSDIENDHALADGALLAFINDEEVSRLYGEISKWYA